MECLNNGGVITSTSVPTGPPTISNRFLPDGMSGFKWHKSLPLKLLYYSGPGQCFIWDESKKPSRDYQLSRNILSGCQCDTPLLHTIPGYLDLWLYLHLARLEMRLSVFRELLSLRCINFKNLCAHHQEEVLRIPKHPQLARFALF